MITSAATTRITAPAHPAHPLGPRARILLTSVFGPYAQDDEYGSRAINPMELYENQVTRTQGVFSLRMFHRSWGLMMIRENITAPCAMLDFPTLDRFIDEITTHRYDIVGISGIMPNIGKVHEMCRLVRRHLPEATIVVGGHIANIPDLDERIDADHIVQGEGIRWMRRFLGEDEDRPIQHPEIVSAVGSRSMGSALNDSSGEIAAAVIPSVGCPKGCNFCSTSAMFGGKGKFVHFFETGDELFEIMCRFEKNMKTRSFFMMDENFLLYKKRALRLLELMVEHNKPWAMYVFSSADVLRSYTMEQIVGLGISWVWMGLEGKNSQYSKLKGTDTHGLVRTLQSHGVRVLGSTIIGLEDHTPKNMDAVIEHAVSHDTEFHQFMLYTPIPGTPLHAELTKKGVMLDESECPLPDTHGQFKFNYRHPYITDGRETELILRAFRRDFEVNGPSICRVARTMLLGWKRYKNHPDPRIRARFEWEARELPMMYTSLLWSARNWFGDNPVVSAKLSKVLTDLYREFGVKARLIGPIGGRYVRFLARREERRRNSGWTYEPPTFYEACVQAEDPPS